MKHKRENAHIQLTHSMTHYLLVIHHLKESKGYARITDISREMNITKGSVSIAVNNLKEKKLVEEEPNSKFLQLTEFGHHQVHGILTSRNLLFAFFKDLLKVDEESARNGACDMEHLVTGKIREKFFQFLRTISLPDKDPSKKKLLANIKSFQSDIDLTQYKSLSEFANDQSSEF